jgi:hypothetical protein
MPPQGAGPPEEAAGEFIMSKKSTKTPKAKANTPQNAAQATTVAPRGPRKAKVAKEAKPKKPSGLDLAAQVLKAKGEPMTCRAICDGANPQHADQGRSLAHGGDPVSRHSSRLASCFR